jgi:hypothetical protein
MHRLIIQATEEETNRPVQIVVSVDEALVERYDMAPGWTDILLVEETKYVD